MGRGMLINGRPCRTEVARVNRKFAAGNLDEMLPLTIGGSLTRGTRIQDPCTCLKHKAAPFPKVRLVRC